MKSRRTRDPLALLETVVGSILLASLLGLGILLVVAVVGLVVPGAPQVKVGGAGAATVCVDGVENVATFSNDRRPHQGIVDLDRDRATETADSWRVCIDGATTGDRVLAGVGPVLRWLAAQVALLLVYVAIRTARRRGPFAVATARRVQRLGWFLLGSALLVPMASEAAVTALLARVTTGDGWSVGEHVFDIVVLAPYSWFAVVVAIGVVTVARVLERAVPLQEEVDATV